MKTVQSPHFLASTLPVPPAADWGLTIAILVGVGVYVGKEFVSWFKQKETSETELTTTLISDLRSEGKTLRELQATTLGKLTGLQERTVENLESIGEAIGGLSTTTQQQKRDLTVIQMQLAEQRDKLVILHEQLKALHERLDKVQIPHS